MTTNSNQWAAHQAKNLRRAFSILRVLSGLGLILFSCALVAGCTYASGRGGLLYLIIALPGVGLGLGMIAKPWKFVCNRCQGVAKTRGTSSPFSGSTLGHVVAVAQTGDFPRLDHLLRHAPLPDRAPTTMCTLVALACPCGQSAFLQVATYTVGATKMPFIDKVVCEFGAEVGPQQVRAIAEAGAVRWGSAAHYTGLVPNKGI